MSEYDTLKNGLVTRLAGLGYSEASVAFDFKNASVQEYDKRFILNAMTGDMDDAKSETMVDRVYDVTDWELQIAFSKNALSDIIARDQMHRKKDSIIKDLDNPANWTSFARLIKYKGWKVEETDNYFLLTVTLEIQIQYVY